jgi:hypothetical protein
MVRYTRYGDLQVREDKAKRKQVTLVRAKERQEKGRDEECNVDGGDGNLVLQMLTDSELGDEVRRQSHNDDGGDPLHPLVAGEDETSSTVVESHCFCVLWLLLAKGVR